MAVLRVAIWIWNPDFDDFVVLRSRPCGTRHSIHLSEAQIVMLWYTHIQPTRIYVPRESLRINKASTKAEMDTYERNRRQAARPPHWGSWPVPRRMPAIPLWVLPGLDRSWWDVSGVFDLARRLRTGGPTWQEDLEAFAEAPFYWDLPGWVFMLWVDGHTNQNLIAEQSRWKAYNCRIIRTSDERYHFIPYWTTCKVYRFIPGWLDESVKPSILHDNRELPLTIYGASDDDARILYEFNKCFIANSKDTPALEDPQRQEIKVGWNGLLAESHQGANLSDLRNEIIQQTNDMWHDLEAICLRSRRRAP